MKRPSHVSTARLIQRRDAWLKKLGELGPMTRGSLVTAKRGGHTAHQLTVSVQGKTHTVYVPKDMVEEVRCCGEAAGIHDHWPHPHEGA